MTLDLRERTALPLAQKKRGSGETAEASDECPEAAPRQRAEGVCWEGVGMKGPGVQKQWRMFEDERIHQENAIAWC